MRPVCGFLASQKDGRQVYYRVTEPHLASIMACIEERFGRGKKNRKEMQVNTD